MFSASLTLPDSWMTGDCRFGSLFFRKAMHLMVSFGCWFSPSIPLLEFPGSTIPSQFL